MFGFLARGVSAFVASVSGSIKDETSIEGSSHDDARSVKSTNSSIRRTSDSLKTFFGMHLREKKREKETFAMVF
uniref:Secreted protein n=1 Tax=Caenorhabditis tropicalis TaxID=1561998 RepID=A0A1I7UNN6_9PELO